MNEKEVGELRRRCRPEKNGITRVRGCYVNEKKEIVSRFTQSLGIMTQEENEMLLATLRRTLSGKLGKNLIDLSFPTAQVAQGEEHALLMKLRNSALEDETAVDAFFTRVSEALELEASYLILLVHDRYDVPYRSEDGERQDDAGAEIYSHLLCSICPVKLTKPGLGFSAHENAFHTSGTDALVSRPELGFLFPAFDDRRANLYGALYYSRSAGELHAELLDAVFHTEAPMAADAQKETFRSILGDVLEGACSCEVVQAVHEQLRGMMEEHKASKEPEPLSLSGGAIKCVLKSCGVDVDRADRFEEEYDSAFGAETCLVPGNLVDAGQMEVATPDVTIRVSPDRGDLIKTRTIDGVKYILIRADEGVSVDGVKIDIT